MDASEMKLYLDALAEKYNDRSFIPCDPISIPHRFSNRNDIEASALLTATIAWGRRDLILRSATNMLNMMSDEPYHFITEASEKETDRLKHFVHRTFNGEDAITFITCLRNIYSAYGSLEEVVAEGLTQRGTMKEAIIHLHKVFFMAPHKHRAERHLSDVSKGSAGKKINMFLRWMVRNDNRGVDFGIWESIDQAQLYIPLDLHAGNTARKLGLLTRNQNDWKAVEELTSVLRMFDPYDPVKYDFALFGAGVNNEM